MKLRQDAANQMKLMFPSRSENVGFARMAIATFAAQAEFTIDEIDEIKVVVSEAVSNAVIHGYADANGVIVLEAFLVEGTLELTVEDTGQGIADIQTAREPGSTSRPDERMGLGLTFIQEYMDHVEIQSALGRGTRLTMRKVPEHVGVRH